MRVDRIPGVAATRAILARPWIRRALRWFGVAIVVAGGIWSVATLKLGWSDISLPMLVLNLVVLTPIGSLAAAKSFQITAAATGREVSLREALFTVSSANVAELLPLPGGALVRGAALVKAGASVSKATELVLMTALLTLGLTLSASAAALVALAGPVWVSLFGATLAGTAVVLAILCRRIAVRFVAQMVVIRGAELGLTTLRIMAAFAALHASVGWVEALLYAVAPTLGAAAGIVPAGLGVNEAIAAGLATLIASSSALAFLAVALNRGLSLAVGATIVLISNIWRPR